MSKVDDFHNLLAEPWALWPPKSFKFSVASHRSSEMSSILGGRAQSFQTHPVCRIDRSLARSLASLPPLLPIARGYSQTEVVNLREFAGRRFFRGFLGALSSRVFNVKRGRRLIFFAPRWHWAVTFISHTRNYGIKRARNAKCECTLQLNKTQACNLRLRNMTVYQKLSEPVIFLRAYININYYELLLKIKVRNVPHLPLSI